jgi:hypothetical protein
MKTTARVTYPVLSLWESESCRQMYFLPGLVILLHMKRRYLD